MDSHIEQAREINPDNGSRGKLAEEAFSTLPTSSDPHVRELAEQSANVIFDIVKKNGDFGGPLTFDSTSDAAKATAALGSAMDGGYTDDLVIDLNRMMIDDKSNLRFDLDKHSYLFTAPDSQNKNELIVFDRVFYDLNLRNNMSSFDKTIATLSNNVQFQETRKS